MLRSFIRLSKNLKRFDKNTVSDSDTWKLFDSFSKSGRLFMLFLELED